jgi:hypothetical protein
LQHTCIVIATYATLDLLLQHLDETYATYIKKRMKHTVATCAHLLAAVQWRLVDAAQGSAARGAGGARREAQVGARGADSVRHGRGARHEVRGGSSATVRGASFVLRKVRVGGAGTQGARREAQGRAQGGSVPSERTS